MEDLASVVLDKLKLEDGPTPLALVHRRYGSYPVNDSRWLVINTERVNGNAVYKVNVAAGAWREEVGRDPTWTTVTFADEKAAAAFATAFLRREEEAHLILYELNTNKWSASRSTASLGDCLTRQFGHYAVSTQTDLLAALRALMPLSMIVGEKRVC